MSFELDPIRLGDIAEIFTGYPFKGSDYLPAQSGIRVVRGDNVTERSLRWGEKEKCWQQITPELKPYLLQVGDVVVGMDGSKVGKNFAWISAADGPCLLAQRVARIRGGKNLDQTFLRYLICNSRFTQYVQSIHTGTSIPHISKRQIEDFRVVVPPIAEQIAIGSLLKAIDDRIWLLRDANATLDAIARALFKSWFVDFDPVRAKSEGRETEGLSVEVAELFPSTLVQTQLGLVPEGWEIRTLQDLLVLQRGFDLPSDQRVSGDYPIIAASGPSGTHVMAMAKGPGVITGRSGVIGRVYLELDDYWPLNTSLWVKEFRAATPCYAYELLKRMDLASFNAGSAVPTLNRNHVHSLPCVIPPVELVSAYEAIALSLHKRARENSKHAATLATIRDALLPRLISGQLRLPEAEALLQDAA